MEVRVFLLGGAALSGGNHELRPCIFQRAIVFLLRLLGRLDLAQQVVDLLADRGLQSGDRFRCGAQQRLLFAMVLDGCV